MQSLKEKVKEQLVLSHDIKAIRAIDKLLDYAIGLDAAEICFESGEKGLAVIFRADHETKNKIMIPKKLEPALLDGFKELAGARSLAAEDLPWQGRFKKDYPGRKIVFSLAIRPTAAGEKITIDLKKENFELLEIGRLGFNRRALAAVRKNLDRRKGLTLVIGDHNSGRTTTLYSFLNHLNHPRLNLATIEKDIAYDIPKINQSRLDPAAGFDAPLAARSLRRQDADIVMFGEINDRETAEAAFDLALGGHFVLAGLPGRGLASAVSFLQDAGAPLSSFLAGAGLAITQRLAGKNCPYCLRRQKIGLAGWRKLEEKFSWRKLLPRLKQDKIISAATDKPEGLVFYKSAGCARCRNSGMAGKIGIFEVLALTPEARNLIKSGHLPAISRELERQGGYSLAEDALIKALGGLVGIDEVFRQIG